MEVNVLIKRIKEKPELNGIANSIIIQELEEYLKKGNISLSNLKEKDSKLIVSAIRAKLRRLSGQFKYSSYFEDKVHISSEERKDIYPILISLLEELKIKSILDLGCGLNPLFLSKREHIYHAFEINQSDLDKVNEHFKKNKINGETKIYDLRKSIDQFPKTDICLILKVFDLIESRGHKLAEEIIRRINSDYILISFPTKTLSGAPMKHPQRGWIKRLLFRLDFKYIFFKGRNEIFYLASSKIDLKRLTSLQSIQEMR